MNPNPLDTFPPEMPNSKKLPRGRGAMAINRAAALQDQSFEEEAFRKGALACKDPALQFVPGYTAPPQVETEGRSRPPTPTLDPSSYVDFSYEAKDEVQAELFLKPLKAFIESLEESKSVMVEEIRVNGNKVLARYRPFRAATPSCSRSGSEAGEKPDSEPDKDETTPKASSSTTKTSPADTVTTSADPKSQTPDPAKPGPSSTDLQSISFSTTSASLDVNSLFGFCEDRVPMKGFGGAKITINLASTGCTPAIASQHVAEGRSESFMCDPKVPRDMKVYWLLKRHKPANRFLKAVSSSYYKSVP
nr:MAG: hypothetical protein [Rhabdoviridae sp.]